MILVTGAGGTVGSALVAALREKGHQVRAAHHTLPTSESAGRGEVERVSVDLADPSTLAPAFDGVDSVFLLGAMSPEQTRQELNAVDAARAAGVRRVVKLSVWRADEELTPIARLHRPVEIALERAGIAHTLLRPNFYMQNFARQMSASIRATGEFAQPASRAPISFVDARDVARVAAHVLTSDGHDGHAYGITGPEALTYDQAADVLAEVLGTPVRFVGLSDADARAAMLARGLPEFYADALVEVGAAYRDGGADAVTSVVADLTGSAPVDFARFVHDHRAAFA
jgi:uncharacterized protein YbjT (DUF2867 family)